MAASRKALRTGRPKRWVRAGPIEGGGVFERKRRRASAVQSGQAHSWSALGGREARAASGTHDSWYTQLHQLHERRLLGPLQTWHRSLTRCCGKRAPRKGRKVESGWRGVAGGGWGEGGEGRGGLWGGVASLWRSSGQGRSRWGCASQSKRADPHSMCGLSIFSHDNLSWRVSGQMQWAR